MSDEYDWETNPEGLINWTIISESKKPLFSQIISVDVFNTLPDEIKAKLNLLFGDVVIVQTTKLKKILDEE